MLPPRIAGRSPLSLRRRRGGRRSLAFLPGVALSVLVGASGHGWAQLSPGPLSRSHQKLDGALDCLKCHGGGADAVTQKCLECHRAVAWMIEGARGLHGQPDGGECAACHREHRGRDADLVHWDEGAPEKFDHRRTGWPLEGKHSRTECRKCHQPEHQRSPAVEFLRPERRARSWLGLQTDCTACHDDPHRGVLDPSCRTCHGMDAWKPAPRFDHARTDYPLTGKHTAVDCAKCHLAPGLALDRDRRGALLPRFKPVPHRECSTCHQDPHAGRLGATCSSCHETGGFDKIRQGSFDHARTRFPLLGRHARVECRRCHDPATAWGKKPRFDACGACHADPHAGKATLEGRKVDCASCHREDGWSPSTYTAEQHASAPYSLVGKHRGVKCQGCHDKSLTSESVAIRGKAGVRIRPRHERCRDCHQDAHQGQLSSREDQGACESCHTVEGWKPSTFKVSAHAALDLPLEGRHAELECRACHGPVRKDLPLLPGPEELGSARVSLSLLSPECVACHRDPHKGRYVSGADHPTERGCRECHGTRQFRPTTVDVTAHGRYRFPLEGAHGAVPCLDCHRELREAAAGSTLVAAPGPFRELPFLVEGHERCKTCHASPHGDQLASLPEGDACQTCHDLRRFRPAARFEHARTAFPLDGAHRNVACARCHPSRPGLDGKPLVIFRPLPHRCEDCHTPEQLVPRGAPTPLEPGGAGRPRAVEGP